MMKIALVVAVAENGVIGHAGGLPWKLSSDLKRFKADTMGKPVIMGRKTHESIGRPLPGRLNIVITRNANWRAVDVKTVRSFDDAVTLAKVRGRCMDGADEICVIGGGEIFSQALPRADRLYVTHVLADIEGDTFLPEIEPSVWRPARSEAFPAGEKDSHPTRYVIYERRDEQSGQALGGPIRRFGLTTFDYCGLKWRGQGRLALKAHRRVTIRAGYEKGSDADWNRSSSQDKRNFMPWSNQSGGGGPWGGGGGNNGGGPWGQGPRSPSGPQKQAPDLEDIIRRGQDRLKRALPGGGGVSPAALALIAVALVVLWGFKAIYTVQPDEVAVELRLGDPKDELAGPGLHFHWWPVETVEIANTAEKLVTVGGGGRDSGDSGLMLSGDQNIVAVQFSVAYQVAEPLPYLFNVSDPDDMLRQVAESAMREAVGRRPAQDIFRDDRQGIADDVRDRMQSTLDAYGSGLAVNAISIEDAAPPREVADAFDEVQRAEQDEDRFVEEANQYSNQRLGQARGQSAQIVEEAAAYKNRVVQEAQGEAQRFVSVYDEYAKAPEVTRKRLFLETMEGVLQGSNKVIVEQGSGQGVVPYLPLPELQRRATPAAAAAATPGAATATTPEGSANQ